MKREEALRLAFISIFECQPSYAARDMGAVGRVADNLQDAYEAGRHDIVMDQISVVVKDLVED